MTIKLVLLKSGEEVITNLEEMVVQERTVGYFFNDPCDVKLFKYPSDDKSKNPYRIQLTQWMPLSEERKIPMVADWVVTITTPVKQLLDTYTSTLETTNEQLETIGDDEQSDVSDSD